MGILRSFTFSWLPLPFTFYLKRTERNWNTSVQKQYWNTSAIFYFENFRFSITLLSKHKLSIYYLTFFDTQKVEFSKLRLQKLLHYYFRTTNRTTNRTTFRTYSYLYFQTNLSRAVFNNENFRVFRATLENDTNLS